MDDSGRCVGCIAILIGIGIFIALLVNFPEAVLGVAAVIVIIFIIYKASQSQAESAAAQRKAQEESAVKQKADDKARYTREIAEIAQFKKDIFADPVLRFLKDAESKLGKEDADVAIIRGHALGAIEGFEAMKTAVDYIAQTDCPRVAQRQCKTVDDMTSYMNDITATLINKQRALH